MFSPPHLPVYYDAGPFLLATAFPQEHLQQALEYKHKSGDVFVVTYPKNGTTWTQQLVYTIMNDGQFGGMDEMVGGFIDMIGSAAVTSVTTRAIKSHIIPDLLWKNAHAAAKYIIVVRNPKDTCVSHFHHTKGLPFYNFRDGRFDDFFDLFMTGEVEYGDYFKWIVSASKHRNDDNVLFLTYESMKKDTEAAAHRIAQFLSTDEVDYGSRFVSDLEYRSRILKHSSVSFMKANINEAMRSNWPSAGGQEMTLEFVRKGEVNDWKNLMTGDQSERMSDRFRETAKQHPDLMTIWDDYSWL